MRGHMRAIDTGRNVSSRGIWNVVPCWLVLFLIAAVTTVLAGEGGGGRSYGVIVGQVVDSSDGEGLPLATVNLSDGLRIIKADARGEFRFEGLQAGTYTLRVTHVGYSSEMKSGIDVRAGDTVKVVVALVVEPRSVRSIVVTPGSYSIADDAPSASQTVSREEIVTAPQLGEDFFRAVGHLPGISGNDFSSRIEVRGGENEEVLVLLDGMEIQEPFHIKDLDGGAVSAIDVAAVGGVDVLVRLGWIF